MKFTFTDEISSQQDTEALFARMRVQPQKPLECDVVHLDNALAGFKAAASEMPIDSMNDEDIDEESIVALLDSLNPQCPFDDKCTDGVTVAECRFANTIANVLCSCRCVCHGEGGEMRP